METVHQTKRDGGGDGGGEHRSTQQPAEVS